jgi:uncharacterized 2Fe-2S/4Fe-4S cluster protein (DUF4445 family)
LKKHLVEIHQGATIIKSNADDGENLLTFLQKNGINMESPCGGNGKCGKCKVMVKRLFAGSSDSSPSSPKKAVLTAGYYQACQFFIYFDIRVELDAMNIAARILTQRKRSAVQLQPAVIKKYVRMNPPGLDDQRSDLQRIMDGLKIAEIVIPVELEREIPDLLRSSNFQVTLAVLDKSLIAVEAGDTTDVALGIAVDLGTTTVAAYLYDLATGEELAVSSCLNPQRKFGEDVLTRIDFSECSAESLETMHKEIIDCLNRMIDYFSETNGIKKSNIYAMTVVGNPIMLHFLMKITAKYMAIAPFVPCVSMIQKFRAVELGIKINSCGYVIILPAAAAYIGADTIAAVLASAMEQDDQMALLLDIGTNSEIVLGNREEMYACATAAGPAFEGVHLRNGVGGVKGAIDGVSFDNQRINISTIGDEKAIGICGSGFVDAVSQMYFQKIIDKSGRIIVDVNNNEISAEFKGRLIETDGFAAFKLLDKEENLSGMDICITQKDIRELQSAKAAIAAGIKVLVKEAGIGFQEIKRVYLAGGFGNFLNIESAVRIGLLPFELKDKICLIGNAAGEGAVQALLSVGMLQKAEELTRKIQYIELATSAIFMDEYIDSIAFV